MGNFWGKEGENIAGGTRERQKERHDASTVGQRDGARQSVMCNRVR